MRWYIARVCVAATAAGVALSTVGMSGASASGASPQALRVPSVGRPLAAASPGAQLWVKRYNGTGNNNDLAKAVAVSPDGKTVYVTGQSYGTTGVVDWATVAYAAATGAQQWVARYNGPSGSLSNVPSAVAVSPDGKTVYVTGTTRVGQFGDYATVGYDAGTGHQLWAKGYNGPLNNDDEATAMAVSPGTGTVYVTGFSWGNATGSDYATIAYTASGTQLWVKRYNGPPGNGNDNANAVTVSPAGTVYVTGESTGSCCSGWDYATVAYNASGTQLWVKRYAGPGNGTDDASSVTVNPGTGAVYVTGYSWGTSNTPDYATVAYTASGTQQWVARYNGPDNYYDQATSVAVSPATGTVFVTGKSTGTGTTGYDYATIAYTPAGKQLWLKRYNGPGNGNDIANSVAVSPTGSTVYVTGQSVAATGVFDYTTIGYNSASGTQQWIKHPGGSELYPNSMAVSPATGTVFVTGANAADYITIAYSG